MNAELLDGFLPCEAFEVVVQYGPEEVLSPLEIEVIQAIGSGVNRLDRLIDIYRLGNRPMFDLVSDLWKTGYLSVNLHDGTLHVDKDLEQRIRNRRFEDLTRTEVKERSLLLMQELITGEVLPVFSHTSTNNSYHIIPQLLPFESFREIDLSGITDLISRLTFDRRDGLRPYKILNAYLQSRMQGGSAAGVARRLLRLKLECNKRQDRPIAVIAAPATLDGQVKRRLERAIGGLVEERPDDPFCRRFLERLDKQSVQTSGGTGWKRLEELLADLERRIESLGELSIEDRQARHQALTEIAELALEAFRQRRAGRARVRLLPNREETLAAIGSALDQAKHQVVLCSPRASYTAISKYWGLIKDLMKRGVSFFFLWGESRASVLDKQIERNLIGLASRKNHANRLHWCREGVGTNESFLIVDGSLGILSSFSLLADERGIPGLSPAVEFRSLDKGPCGAVLSLLDRVRRNVLDYALARSFSEFSPGAEDEESTLRTPTIPDPPLHTDKDSELAAADTEKLYPDAWKGFLRELQAATAGLGDSVETVFDGHHRQLLMQTLASRPANLLLVSHWVSLDALNPEVEDELAACAANEAAISILYDSGRQKDERAVERVASLATRCPSLRERQLRIAGGIMATDRFTLVSGFDILGTPGFLQQDPRQRRLEAGILVHSPGFAAEISRLYGHQGVPSAHGEDRPGDAQSPAAEGLTSQDHRDLQRLFSDLGKGKGLDDDAEQEAADAPTERMLKDAALLALDQGHWKLFDAFVRRLPSRLGCRAVATLLGLEAGSEGQGTDQREYDQWRSWLIKEKWKHQQFVEATLLLIGDRRSDGDGLPTLELARAASICGMKDYTEDRSELLIDAFDCKYDPDRAIAWNCIATLELLVHAVPEANEVLRYLEPQVPNSWKAWNRLLISFWQKEGQAIPLERLEARRKEHALQDEQDQAHARLLQAIAKLDQVMSGFHSTLGNRAKKEFMKPDGKIGSLSGLVHEQDSVGAARWLWELGDHRIDSESMLARVERIVYERDPQAVGNKRIKGVRRRHCLSAIDQIIGDTRDWVARSERLATVGEVDYLGKQALDLGRELEERIAAIEANPEPLDRAVSRPLFEAMKRRLEILWTQT